MPGDPAGSLPDVMAEHRLAVGVLELVDVRSAGVVFTVDPVSGDASRMVIEANWGFGESVVSGQVTRITGKPTGPPATSSLSTSAANGPGRSWIPRRDGWRCGHCRTARDPGVPRRARSPLPVPAGAAAIEDAAGGAPQDVEWAIARGLPFPDSVFILQHRPVTTLDGPHPATPPAARDPGPRPATRQPATAAGRRPAFDPVQYALRNVFRVPGK